MKLELSDLVPAEATFQLTEKPGKIYTLKKFSLAEQIWAKQRFGDRLGQILEKVELEGIAELAHHLLKDKTDFPTFMDFAECIVTHKDKLGIMTALVGTIGVSQPILDRLAQEESQNPNA